LQEPLAPFVKPNDTLALKPFPCHSADFFWMGDNDRNLLCSGNQQIAKPLICINILCNCIKMESYTWLIN
jgi:hypothetical protein